MSIKRMLSEKELIRREKARQCFINWNKSSEGRKISKINGYRMGKVYGKINGKLCPSDEAKRKNRESNLGKVQSKESNLKRSKTLRGRKPWNVGLTKEIDERLAKLANTKKGTKINYPKIINTSRKVREAARLRMIELNKSEKRREQEKERMIKLAENHPIRSQESRRKIAENTTKRMLGGQAAYMNSCNKSPSKPQVELFKKIKKLYPQAQLNYPSLNRSIDIAIPDLMIAIEYDGSYWHQDGEADKIRQQELEEVGWKFVRYCDYVPDAKELVKDVNN